MKSIYFIQYEVRPAPNSKSFHTTGGAYVNCFIQAASETDAMDIAKNYLNMNEWSILSIEEGPFITLREYYEDEPMWLEKFTTAASEGECYVFYEWPPEAQEEDAIH